jgi:hypothetical protein
MIRRPDTFPDVDRMIDEAAQPPAVLDYHGAHPTAPSGEFDSLKRSVRRTAFACGLTALAGGLGLSLSHGNGDGALLMALGAFVVGLILPIPGTGRVK